MILATSGSGGGRTSRCRRGCRPSIWAALRSVSPMYLFKSPTRVRRRRQRPIDAQRLYTFSGSGGSFRPNRHKPVFKQQAIPVRPPCICRLRCTRLLARRFRLAGFAAETNDSWNDKRHLRQLGSLCRIGAISLPRLSTATYRRLLPPLLSTPPIGVKAHWNTTSSPQVEKDPFRSNRRINVKMRSCEKLGALRLLSRFGACMDRKFRVARFSWRMTKHTLERKYLREYRPCPQPSRTVQDRRQASHRRKLLLLEPAYPGAVPAANAVLLALNRDGCRDKLSSCCSSAKPRVFVSDLSLSALSVYLPPSHLSRLLLLLVTPFDTHAPGQGARTIGIPGRQTTRIARLASPKISTVPMLALPSWCTRRRAQYRARRAGAMRGGQGLCCTFESC
ncbi:hypothetical protein C8F01DRAFT_1122058 [Mycena amicta]|nr:hypothetical protein C8F01DRAFT_1122058 [Mycena amicta]